MKLAAVAIASFIAGFLQGCTGFGAVMIMMIILPFFFPIADSIGISNSSTLAGNISVASQYRKHFKIKKVLIPSIISMVVSGLAILVSINIDKALVKKAFGIFLILLAVYYLFFNKGKNLNFNSGSILLSLCVIRGDSLTSGPSFSLTHTKMRKVASFFPIPKTGKEEPLSCSPIQLSKAGICQPHA